METFKGERGRHTHRERERERENERKMKGKSSAGIEPALTQKTIQSASAYNMKSSSRSSLSLENQRANGFQSYEVAVTV